jgi:hypothetical protein
MTRVRLDRVETAGATSDVWIRNSTHSDGGYYSAASALTVGSATIANVNFSAGAASSNLGSVVLSNSNGVSFGLNASTITASHNGLTSQSNQAFSASGGSSAFQTLEFANSNGLTFSNSNGSVVGSYTVPSTAGLLSAVNLSAGTTSNNLSAVTFSNANGITFGLNASTVTASHNGITSQSNQALSAANGSFTFQTATFANSNGISFSTGTQGLYASHNAITSQSNQQVSLYAVGNTTQSSSGTQGAASLSFRGAGVASVGVTGGSVVVSVPAGGGGITNINVSAGTTSNNLSALTLSNGGGVSFGLNGSVVTASVDTPTVFISAGASNVGNNAFTFSNANGVSFGINGAAVVTASVNAGGGGAGLSAGTQSVSTGTVNFADSNGITFGMSGSSRITASHNGLTSQSNQAFSAPGGSSTFQTLAFSNNGLMAWSNSNGQVVGTPTINIEAGTQGGNAASISFSNANGVTFGNNNGTITASVAAAGGGVTLTGWPNYPLGMVTLGTTTNTTALGAPTTSATICYEAAPFILPQAVAFNQPRVALSCATVAGTGSVSQQHAVGLYTFNGATLSLSTSWVFNFRASQNSSTAQTINWFFGTHSTQNSSQISGAVANSITGLRILTMGSNAHTLSAGNYVLVYAHSRSSVGANVWSMACGFISESQSTMGAVFGSAQTVQAYERFLATQTFSTSYQNASEWWKAALPAAISTSALTARQVGSKWPLIIFQSTG